MNIDSRLLANMIASGLNAAAETLREPMAITLNDEASIVYVAMRGPQFFRIHVEQIPHPFPAEQEEPRHG